MAQALGGEISVEDYMLDILEGQKENQEKSKNNAFNALIAKQTPGDQDPGGAKDAKEIEEKINARAEKIAGGRK